MWIRFLLLALIPLILIAIYIEGQDYEPQIVRFAENSIETELKTLLSDKIDSYHPAGSPRIYNSENLYEYINGHAEYFISAGFSAVIVREYANKDKTIHFRVEAYRMNKAIEALGVLNDESAFDAKPIAIGTAAYLSDEFLSFSKGPYYIKIIRLKGNPDLMKIAEALLNFIRTDDSSLDILKEFPEIGKPIKTEYHRQAYRGIEFLNEIVVRKYSLKGKEISVFMKKTTPENLNTTLNNLINYFKNNDIPFDIKNIINNKLITIDDPYEGRWFIYFAKDRFIGLSGISGQKEVQEILERIMNKVERT